MSRLKPLSLVLILLALAGCQVDPNKTSPASSSSANASSDGKIPISTKSEEARKEFLAGRDLSEKLRITDSIQHYDKAIALDPKIVFYDEPSAGLDPIVTGVIDKLMIDLSRALGITSLVVTHDMNSIFRIADLIIMLHRGRIVVCDTPENVRNSDDPLIQQFITGAPDGPIPLRMSQKDYREALLEL